VSALPQEAPQTKADKFKTLAALSKNLDRELDNTNTLIRMGDRQYLPVPHIPTGLAELDHHALVCGGIPKGRIIEIFGPEAAGKTSLTLYLIGVIQKAGGVAAFIDAEHALDPQWARKLGVNVDELFISQPDYGEQALQIVDHLVESRAVDVVVVDSVSALVPKAELDGDIGDAHVGQLARLMSQALRILTAKAAKNGVTIIFINQIREKIGVMFGNPETTTGGRALKFFSSVRIDVRRQKAKEEDEIAVSAPIKVKIVKNKVGAPFRECFVVLHFEKGFDSVDSLIKMAKRLEVFEMKGSRFNLNGKELANGIDNLVATAKEEVEVQDAILAAVKQKIAAQQKELQK